MCKPNRTFLKKLNTISAIIILSLCITSCTQKGEEKFYCDITREGIWRMPIIEPFELITSDTTDTWNLYSIAGTSEEIFQYSADSIGYSNGKIVISSRYSHLRLGVVDIKNNKVIEFSNRESFYEYERKDSFLHKLYKSNDIFNVYKKKGGKSLPWINEVKGFTGCIK